jgi:preprotein translocase subunit Sec63
MKRTYRNPHGILGIPLDAGDAQIKNAYRSLAKRFHPDRNPDDPQAEERFKQVQWAYETLTGKKGEEVPPSARREGRPRTADYVSDFEHPINRFYWSVWVHLNRMTQQEEDFYPDED